MSYCRQGAAQAREPDGKARCSRLAPEHKPLLQLLLRRADRAACCRLLLPAATRCHLARTHSLSVSLNRPFARPDSFRARMALFRLSNVKSAARQRRDA